MEPSKADTPACDAFLFPAGHAFHPRRTNRLPSQQLKTMKLQTLNKIARIIADETELKVPYSKLSVEKTLTGLR